MQLGSQKFEKEMQELKEVRAVVLMKPGSQMHSPVGRAEELRDMQEVQRSRLEHVAH